MENYTEQNQNRNNQFIIKLCSNSSWSKFEMEVFFEFLDQTEKNQIHSLLIIQKFFKMNPVLPQNSFSESLQGSFDDFGGSSTLGEKLSKQSANKQPNMFLSSLHQILEAKLNAFYCKTNLSIQSGEYQSMITWNEDGTAFIITKPEVFAETVLPKYYKHNKLLSFVRQVSIRSWGY